jgi:hypothetical protein
MTYVEFGCRCALLVVFALSSVGKVRSGTAFAEFRVATVALVPAAKGAATAVAAVVAGAEIAVVVMLAVPVTVPVGLLGAAGLLGAFTAAIAAALRRGNTEPCRCFGTSSAPLGARHLVRNALLCALACLALTLPRLELGTVEPAALAMAAVAGLVVAGIVTNFDAVADLLAPEPVHRNQDRTLEGKTS